MKEKTRKRCLRKSWKVRKWPMVPSGWESVKIRHTNSLSLFSVFLRFSLSSFLCSFFETLTNESPPKTLNDVSYQFTGKKNNIFFPMWCFTFFCILSRWNENFSFQNFVSLLFLIGSISFRFIFFPLSLYFFFIFFLFEMLSNETRSNKCFHCLLLYYVMFFFCHCSCPAPMGKLINVMKSFIDEWIHLRIYKSLKKLHYVATFVTSYVSLIFTSQIYFLPVFYL